MDVKGGRRHSKVRYITMAGKDGSRRISDIMVASGIGGCSTKDRCLTWAAGDCCFFFGFGCFGWGCHCGCGVSCCCVWISGDWATFWDDGCDIYVSIHPFKQCHILYIPFLLLPTFSSHAGRQTSGNLWYGTRVLTVSNTSWQADTEYNWNWNLCKFYQHINSMNAMLNTSRKWHSSAHKMLLILCTSWQWNAMNRPLTTHRVDCIDSLMETSCCMFSKFVIVSSVCLISSIRARLITGVMHSCEPFQVENPSSIHEGITMERKRACSRRSWWGTTFSFF